MTLKQSKIPKELPPPQILIDGFESLKEYQKYLVKEGFEFEPNRYPKVATQFMNQFLKELTY